MKWSGTKSSIISFPAIKRLKTGEPVTHKNIQIPVKQPQKKKRKYSKAIITKNNNQLATALNVSLKRLCVSTIKNKIIFNLGLQKSPKGKNSSIHGKCLFSAFMSGMKVQRLKTWIVGQLLWLIRSRSCVFRRDGMGAEGGLLISATLVSATTAPSLTPPNRAENQHSISSSVYLRNHHCTFLSYIACGRVRERS